MEPQFKACLDLRDFLTPLEKDIHPLENTDHGPHNRVLRGLRSNDRRGEIDGNRYHLKKAKQSRSTERHHLEFPPKPNAIPDTAKRPTKSKTI
jgi:hypothetical protein